MSLTTCSIMPVSLPDFPVGTAVVCHDAGAANIVLAWIASAQADVRAVMVGPAEALWRARFGDAPLCGSLDEALEGTPLLVSGTGWGSDLEHDARVLAHAQGTPTVAVLDHWVNYAPRFERDGIRMLPDTLWVADDNAATLAADCFPSVPVAQWTNLYQREQVAGIAPAPADGDVLFILEPARDDWGRGAPGEFQALDYFMAHRSALGVGAAVPIRLRPHPSDPAGKYDSWIAANPPAVLDDASALSDAISRARHVVGLQSAALVIALDAGRGVISSLPPWAPRCKLPHDGLVHLGDRVRA